MLDRKKLTFVVEGLVIELDPSDVLASVRELTAEHKANPRVRTLQTRLSAAVTVKFIVESVRPTTHPAAMWKWWATILRTDDGKRCEIQVKGETAEQAEENALGSAQRIRQSAFG